MALSTCRAQDVAFRATIVTFKATAECLMTLSTVLFTDYLRAKG
jgi:hypothetical protein